MLTKALTHIFFDDPKSSFGEHKVLTKGLTHIFLDVHSFGDHTDFVTFGI